MARRTILVAVAMIAACAALAPTGASAATAPAAAPVLTSALFAGPVRLQWTPANDPLNVSQAVYRTAGVCTSPVTEGAQIVSFPGNSTADFTQPGEPVDGIYCYYIKAADLLTTANSPGLTVVVDRADPTATIAVTGHVAGYVSGTVGVVGTGEDAGSGVASSLFHIGAVGACPAGAFIGSTWDTTATPNGAYDVCNVVTDRSGRVATAVVTMTVANVVPVAAAPAAAPAAAAGADTVAPAAPRPLRVIVPRAKGSTAALRARLRWTKPTAPDLDRVVVVLNRKRAPRGPADGTRIYRGLGSSIVLRALRPGQKAYVAVFAYDHSGNVSKAARRLVSLASMIPLRPLTGSVVDAAPRLTWTPKAGSAYYNVQIFRNGKRVLVGWPSRASYVIPAGSLLPGTYVWFVWPAVKVGGAAPTYADLIGRATFVVKE